MSMRRRVEAFVLIVVNVLRLLYSYSVHRSTTCLRMQHIDTAEASDVT